MNLNNFPTTMTLDTIANSGPIHDLRLAVPAPKPVRKTKPAPTDDEDNIALVLSLALEEEENALLADAQQRHDAFVRNSNL